MKKFTIILSILFFWNTAEGADEIFRWSDDDGTPHMTDSLEKVPKKYRDKVKVRSAGKPSGISISDHTAPPKKSKKPDSPPPAINDEKRYGGETLDWWVKSIELTEKKIEIAELNLESKKLTLDSHETTIVYSRDLSRQVKDLKQRLKNTKARKTDKKLYTEEQKKKDILYLVKEIKKVQARKNANLVKEGTKDAIKTSEEEIEIMEKELEELRTKLNTIRTDARKAGVPQKYFYK